MSHPAGESKIRLHHDVVKDYAKRGHQVKIEKKVLKRLEKIPEPIYKSLKDSILELGNEPRPNRYIKLKGRAGYRIRVGNY